MRPSFIQCLTEWLTLKEPMVNPSGAFQMARNQPDRAELARMSAAAAAARSTTPLADSMWRKCRSGST
jgi:hypothetical protein